MYCSENNNIILDLNHRQSSWIRRFSIPLGVLALAAFSLAMAMIIVSFGASSFVMIILGLIVVPVVYVVIAYPRTGIMVLLTMAYIIMFFGKFNTTFPIGVGMDVLIFLLVFSFFLKQKYAQNWSMFKDEIGMLIIVWIAYNFIEVINPAAESQMAWLYSVRPIAFVPLTFFLFRFFITDKAFIKNIFRLWIGLSVIAALYAIKQEYFGFAEFEMESFRSNPLTASLYFIGNHWRKPSIFSDPVAFAYNMVISAILCFCLATGPVRLLKKVTLISCGCLFLVTMLYSGTRGAYVIIPVAVVLFSVLKYNKKIILIGCCMALAMAFVIMMPTSNYTLYRFQSAFKPNKDASFNVRKINQERIQPYIQTHPIGGGVGSTGVWGQRFSPHSFLASFPPDSGYVRVAVELGWIGLLIFCTFMFVALKVGITNYFAIRDPELKSYCLAMVMILFALNIGNYPQEALVQYPISIYFFLALALVVIARKLDNEKYCSQKLKN